ncbi:Adenylate kinase 9 [Hondaea fermentalgiana]|uniref:Adenylate kinase 9 n=1 Tax=Hondaea fermentalgiana TaxID=2315210 RepID=A0A2R5GRI1_9STRA|nr:Adenylate kinase 9 [Hondaea fermentalgiana]|eukprot:GBG30951.1 Adenylate kinase 9 [Hondaea fermentalgiana]
MADGSLEELRRQVAQDKGVRRAAIGLWALLGKYDAGLADRGEVEKLASRVAKTLLAGCSDEHALATARQAFLATPTMDISQFLAWILGIAHLYCESANPLEYEAFLVGLKLRITSVYLDDASFQDKVALSAKVCKVPYDGDIEAFWRMQIAAGFGNTWKPERLPSCKSSSKGAQLVVLVPVLDTDAKRIDKAVAQQDSGLKVCLQKLTDLGEVVPMPSHAGIRDPDEPHLLWSPQNAAQTDNAVFADALLMRYTSTFGQSTPKAKLALQDARRAESDMQDAKEEEQKDERNVMPRRHAKIPAGGLGAVPPHVVVVGPPRSGKTSVAKCIAERAGLPYIKSADACSFTLRDAIAACGGYAVDANGSIEATRETDEETRKAILPSVVIHLKMREEDARKRLASLRVHPDAGEIYTGAQVAEMRAAEEREAEAKARKAAAAAAREAQGEDGEDVEEQDEPEAGDEGSVSEDDPENKVVVPRLEDLKPLHTSEEIDEMLNTYNDIVAEAEKEAVRIIEVDATLPFHRMVESAFDRLSDANGGLAEDALTKAYNVPRPLLYTPPEPVDGATDDAAEDGDETPEEPVEPPLEGPDEERELRHQLLYNVSVEFANKSSLQSMDDAAEASEEEVPVQYSPPQASFRHLSPWGLTCPVSCEEGRARYSILWRGLVYFCASKEAMQTFMKDPKAYALGNPQRAGRILVVAGESILADQATAALVQTYGWENMTSTAGAWYVEPETTEEEEKAPDDEINAEGEGSEQEAPPREHPLATTLSGNRWALAVCAETVTPERALEVLESANRLPRLVVFVKKPPPQAKEPSSSENSETQDAESAAQDAETSQENPQEEVDPAQQTWADLCDARGVPFLPTVSGQSSSSCSDQDQDQDQDRGQDQDQDQDEVHEQDQAANETTSEEKTSEELSLADFTDPLEMIPRALEEEFASKAIEDGNFAKILGWSGSFCPVTLIESGRLVPGQAELVAYHERAFFKLASNAAMEAFRSEPARFARPDILMRPNPVVLLLGAAGTGKTASADFLATSFGLRKVSRRDLEIHVATRRLARQTLAEGVQSVTVSLESAAQTAPVEATSEEAEENDDAASAGENVQTEEAEQEPADEANEDAPDEEAIAEARREAERAADEEVRYAYLAETIRAGGCVLDDVLDEMIQVERLASELLVPTVVLRLVADQEVAVERTMMATFRWTPPVPKAQQDPEALADGTEGDEAEEEEQNPEELREAARAAWEENVRAQFTQREEVTAAMLQFLSAAGVTCHDNIDMSGKAGLQPSLRRLRAAVQVHTRSSPRALDAHQTCLVSHGMANKLREEGLVTGAPLGSRCPAELVDYGQLFKCHNQSVEDAAAGVVVYNGQLFAPGSVRNAKRLLDNPGPFAERSKSLVSVPPRQLFRSSVVGGAEGRSTAVAQSLSKALGAVYVSVETALEYVQARAIDEDSGELWVLGALLQNGEPSAELVMQCVVARCKAEDASLRGFVLDQFPRTVLDAAQLESEGLLPDALVHCGALHGPCLGDLVDLENWFAGWASVSQVHVSADTSVWRAVDRTCAALVQENSPSSCATSSTVREDEEIGAQIVDLLGTLGSYDLLENSPALGYCLVSFADGSQESLQKGSPSTLARHKGQLYAFTGPEEAARFVQDPNAFVTHVDDLCRAVKALPLSPAAMLAQGDRIGYLEHTLAPLLREGLEQCGIQRLKHPSLSIEESCAKFLALFLRARNEKVSRTARVRREEMLDQFLSECQLFEQIAEQAVGGSGLRAVRSCRNDLAARAALVDRFEDLLQQPPSILVARFTPSQ